MHARGWRILSAVAAVGVGSLLVGGIAWAAIPGSNGTISGCYDRNGALRVIDAEAGAACERRETALAWNQAGPPGPPGPSDAYVTTVSPQSPLLDGVVNTVASMNVPAGLYVIDAQVRVRSQVIYDGGSLSCDLYAGGQQLDIFLVSYEANESFEERVAPLAGWGELLTPGTIEIRCRAEYQDVDLSTLGVFESPLIAIKVGSISVDP